MVDIQNMYPCLTQVMPVLDVAKLVSLTLDSLGLDRSKHLLRAALEASKAALSSNLWKVRHFFITTRRVKMI